MESFRKNRESYFPPFGGMKGGLIIGLILLLTGCRTSHKGTASYRLEAGSRLSLNDTLQIKQNILSGTLKNLSLTEYRFSVPDSNHHQHISSILRLESYEENHTEEETLLQATSYIHQQDTIQITEVNKVAKQKKSIVGSGLRSLLIGAIFTVLYFKCRKKKE